MKAKNIITAMFIMMIMGTGTMSANTNVETKNDRGHNNITAVANDRHNDHHFDRRSDRGYDRAHDRNLDRNHGLHHNAHHSAPGIVVRHDGHRYINGHDIHGYEGRVRYDRGVYSYYRDGRWYHYNHYIDVRDYYSNSLAKFGTGIVIGAVIGGIISAIAR